MSLLPFETPRALEIRRQIAALENERDAPDLIGELGYIAGHVAILADAAFDASDSRAKEGLCIMARDLAQNLADRLDGFAMAQGGAA